jgi:serine/threonine-protein kinase
VLAAVIVLALAGLLWWLINPTDQNRPQSTAGAPVDAVAPVSPFPDSTPPARDGQNASAGARPSRKTAAPPQSPAGRPGRTPSTPPTADRAPATTDPAEPDDNRAPTTTPPTPDDPDPVVRTFTSSAGTVDGTCTSASTAQLVSWSPIGEFKVKRVEQGPRAKALVVFKHGKTRVRMTVTCSNGVPSNTSTDEE